MAELIYGLDANGNRIPIKTNSDGSLNKGAASLGSQNATILSGQSLSDAQALSGGGIARIIMPSTWTTAVMTFQTSNDGVTYSNLYDQYGNEYQITVAASRAIILDPTTFHGFNYVKLRSGTSGTPVNQGADRVIALVTKVF